MNSPRPAPSVETLLRQLERERQARKNAEAILEAKSLELYKANRAIEESRLDLERRVAGRTSELETAQSELLDTLDALRIAKSEAESASEAKSAFLANISHEVRTPLNAILGFTNLLRSADATDAEEKSEWIETIRQSSLHLLTLVGEILDLSKIEAGQLEIESVACDPILVIGEVLSMHAVRATENSLDLSLEFHGPIPTAIVTDPVRLRQILSNVVSNAIKFTLKGSVTLRVEAQDGSTPKMRFSVIDSGIGIEPDKLEAVFHPFVQADSSTARVFGGTGLGLSISRQLAECLGGTITVESSVGVGSTFTLEISTGSLDCVRWIDDPKASTPSPSTSKQELERPKLTGRVLVVDDAEANRRLLDVVLTRGGADVTTARNGREAAELGGTGQFDVILIDMQMPVLDGYAATRELRALGVQIPIIAVTAHAMRGERDKCLAAGCSSYLAKPIDQERLFHHLAELLGSSLPSTAPGRRPPSTSTTVAKSNADRGDPIVCDLLIDDETFRDIASDFCQSFAETSATLNEESLPRDLKRLATVAHTLRGSGAAVGFPIVSEAAIEVHEAIQSGSIDAIETSVRTLVALSHRIVVPALRQDNDTVR